MLYLIVLIILFAAFNLLFRQAQRAGVELHAGGVVLFATASLLYLVRCGLHPVAMSPHTIVLALVAGVLFFGMYALMIPTMSDRGVSVMTALQQLSMLVPTVASLLIWHEVPTPIRIAGITLCLAAIPLLTLDKGLSGEGVTMRKWFIFIAMAVVNGIALTASKVFQELKVPEQLDGYLCLLLATAAVALLPSAIKQRPQVTAHLLGWGALLGVALGLGQMFMLLTLRVYPGVIVYPVALVANLAVVTLASAVLWREVPGRLGRVGIVVAAAAVVLSNL